MRGTQNSQSLRPNAPNTPPLTTAGPNPGDDIAIMMSGAYRDRPVRDH